MRTTKTHLSPSGLIQVRRCDKCSVLTILVHQQPGWEYQLTTKKLEEENETKTIQSKS